MTRCSPLRRARAGVLAGVVVAELSLAAAAQPRPIADPDLAKSDAALLQDETKAIAEFQRRLRNQVEYRNGLLIIQDRSGGYSGITVMPATIIWAVDCGDGGLTVTFGTGSGDTDLGVPLQLTSATVPAKSCQNIAPAIGETVLTIAKGN